MPLKIFLQTLIVLLLSSTWLAAQGLDHYRLDDEVFAENALINQNGKLVLFSKIALLSQADIDDYRFKLYFSNGYSDKDKTAVSADSVYLGSLKQLHYFKFTLSDTAPQALLWLEVKSLTSQNIFSFDIPGFNISPVGMADQIDKPVVNPWVSKGSFTLTAPSVFGYYYGYNFPPASPPMVTNQELDNKEFKVDSVFHVNYKLKFEQEGLYLFQTDTTSGNALAIRVVDKYFPKLVTIEQLVEPLIYITSKEEQEQLSKINGDKKQFDKFWLDLTKSPERAKVIIRTYYDRLEIANRLFTTYKEGWKTDMGMIYMIMGPPDEVEKSIKEETWVYLANRDLPKRKYTFIRTNSIFSSKHFALIREKKHAEYWFEAIDLLRKGILINN